MTLDWLVSHASLVLFVNLSCGLIGIPALSETLLLVSGALAARGDRSLVEPFVAAAAGSAIGMTISFAIGRWGRSIAERCVSRLGVRAERFDALRDRCRRYAAPLVTCSYFTPGLRHLTAMAVGASNVRIGTFVASAVAGACAWSALLLWTGMAAGSPAAAMSMSAARYIPVAWAIAIAAALWALRATRRATTSR